MLLELPALPAPATGVLPPPGAAAPATVPRASRRACRIPAPAAPIVGTPVPAGAPGAACSADRRCAAQPGLPSPRTAARSSAGAAERSTAGTAGRPGCRSRRRTGSRATARKSPKRLLVGRRHLQPDQDAAVVGALVAVVEQADVPARRHARQEAHQRAGPLREDEAVAAARPAARAAAAADHVADVLLGQLVAGQVERREAVARRSGARAAPTRRGRRWRCRRTRAPASASEMR